MISAKEEVINKQEHAEVLDGANHSVELHFICCIVALGAREGPIKESHWML